MPFIIAAAIAALIWVWAFAVSHSKAAATFAWAAVCLSAPFVLNSRNLLPAAFVDLFNTIRNLPAASLTALASGAPGLLFDQEFGIFAYAPVLLLGFVGLAGMVLDRSLRVFSAGLIVGAIVLIALAGSLNPWWSDSMMPGRTVLLALPLLAPPIAWLYARAPEYQLRRAGLQLLVLASLGVMLVIALAANQVPLPQEGDGSSSLLIWMSPTWQLWDDSPTYVAGVSTAAVIQTSLWMTALVVTGWLFWRRPTMASSGSAALVVTTAAVVAVIAVVSTSAALPLDTTRRQFDAEARVLFPMLETFNPVVRPIAVRYDPLSVVSAGELPSLFSLSASPGQRRSRQPLRVALNARFRLAAGEYELTVKGSDEAGTVSNPTLGLQIGREGRPLETWPLPLTPGSVSQHRFRVPLDAEFVGFRASRAVERTIAELRLRALQIVRRGPPLRKPDRPVVSGLRRRESVLPRWRFESGDGRTVGEGPLDNATDDLETERKPDLRHARDSQRRASKQCDPADARLVGANRPGSGSDEEDRRSVECRRTVHPALGNHFRWFRPGGSRQTQQGPASAWRLDHVHPRRYRQNVRSPVTQSFAPIFFPSLRLRGK